MPSSLHCDCALEIVAENKGPRVAVCLELLPPAAKAREALLLRGRR